MAYLCTLQPDHNYDYDNCDINQGVDHGSYIK